MSFERSYISVSAGEFADLINEARRLTDEAQRNADRDATEVRAWSEAVTRLEAFRITVASMLGVASLNNNDDERLYERLRELLAAETPRWQCPQCEESVPGAELMCPTCTGDHAETPAETPPESSAERTGWMEPVPVPLDPARDLEFWDNQRFTPAAAPGGQASAPAHALTEPEPDYSWLAETLSHHGYSRTEDQLRTWTPAMRAEAGTWVLDLGEAERAGRPHPQPPVFLHDTTTGGVDPFALANMLSLVGVTVTAERIHDTWTAGQRDKAEAWASAMHLSANDHDDVVVPPRPEFLATEEPARG
jgi:hypothetical protein